MRDFGQRDWYAATGFAQLGGFHEGHDLQCLVGMDWGYSGLEKLHDAVTCDVSVPMMPTLMSGVCALTCAPDAQSDASAVPINAASLEVFTASDMFAHQLGVFSTRRVSSASRCYRRFGFLTTTVFRGDRPFVVLFGPGFGFDLTGAIAVFEAVAPDNSYAS